MKMNDIKVMAEELGIKTGKMKKTELIRAIQRQECNSDCYNSGQAESCGQDQCLWRADCR
jgi:hypothetical protein